MGFPCPPGTTWPLEEVKQTGTLVPSPLGIGLRAERGQLRGLSAVGTEQSVAGTSHWPVLGAEWPWEVTSASDSQFVFGKVNVLPQVTVRERGGLAAGV